MKKILLVFLLSFLPLLGVAQSWFPIGAKWYFDPYCNQIGYCGYYISEITKDTVLGGDTARVMNLRKVNVVDGVEEIKQVPEGTVFLKEDSNRVYFYESNRYKLLFDMNLNVGDTLFYNTPINWYYYDWASSHQTEENSYDSAIVRRTIVDSISTFEVNGWLGKKMYLHIIGDTDTTSNSKGFHNIKEKIGTNAGFFGTNSTQFFEKPAYFRCYQDDSILFKQIPNECDYIASVDDEVTKHFQILPNPAQNTIQINSEVFIQEISLVNMLGQVLYSETNIQHNKPIVLNISHLKQGVYVIRISANQKIYTYKIQKL